MSGVATPCGRTHGTKNEYYKLQNLIFCAWEHVKILQKINKRWWFYLKIIISNRGQQLWLLASGEKNIFLGHCFYNIQNPFHEVSFACENICHRIPSSNVGTSTLNCRVTVYYEQGRLGKGAIVTLLCRSYPQSEEKFFFFFWCVCVSPSPNILAMALYANECCFFSIL